MKILAIRMDKIGDALLTVPSFRTLRRMYPDAEITALTNTYNRPIIERIHSADEILCADEYSHDELVKLLNERHYDMLISFHDFRPASELILELNIPYKMGTQRNSQHNQDVYPQGFVQNRMHYNHLDKIQHEAQYTLEILEHVDAERYQNAHTEDFSLPLTAEEKATATEFWTREAVTSPALFVSPAMGGSGLTLPIEAWAEVLQDFQDAHPDWTILLGCYRPKQATHDISIDMHLPFDEYAFCQAINDRLQKPATIFANHRSIFHAAAVIQRCDLFLGPSTGTFHLAWTQGTPVVGIFGREPNHCWQRWGSLKQPHYHFVMNEAKEYIRSGGYIMRTLRRWRYSLYKRQERRKHGKFTPKMLYTTFDATKRKELAALLNQAAADVTQPQ